MNGLAYLSAYPEDRERRSGSAPPDLVNAATGNDAVAAAVAQNKLARLGYSAVFMCGARTEQTSRDSPGAPDHGERELDQDFTWVRGHWRRQAHGPGRGLRTLRWLMPFKRYLNRPAAEQHGHVYLVGEDGA